MQKTSLNTIVDLFNKHHDFIISSHKNLDGDALGSEIALLLMLKKMGKNARIINQDKTPEIYRFLTHSKMVSDAIVHNGHSISIKDDTILIILDSSNLDRIGQINVDLKRIKYIVNIDHHPSNTYFGYFNFVNDKASSVGEILYDLLELFALPITKEIADSLYTAIVTDTGSFKYTNTSPKTLRAALKLVQYGKVNPNEITNHVYNNNNISSLKLLGKALQLLQLDSTRKISWTYITRDILDETHANDEDIEGIVDKILSVKTVQVSALFREMKDRTIKVSFRSKGLFNVDQFAHLYDGGGHPNASGCQLKGNIENLMKQVIIDLQKQMKKQKL